MEIFKYYSYIGIKSSELGDLPTRRCPGPGDTHRVRCGSVTATVVRVHGALRASCETTLRNVISLKKT